MRKIVGIGTHPAEQAPSKASPRARRASVEAAAEQPVRAAAPGGGSGLPRWLGTLDDEIARRYERLATPLNEYGYDPFGFDKEIARFPALLTAVMYRYWFRVESHGLENLPAGGPVLIVANHAGNTFAWDAAMIGTAVF